jgi:hypothetical protein
MKLEFSRQKFKKNPPISNFMKIRPAKAELFHADGETDDRYDEADSRLYWCESWSFSFISMKVTSHS